MESDLLIRQEEVGVKGEYDVRKRMMEILFWDIMDPNEVVLEPDEALLKCPAVEESGKRQPVDLKHHRKYTRTNKASTSKELEHECKLHDPKINGLSKDVKNQDQQAAPMLKMGMISFMLRAYWRAPDSDICYVCGQDGHSEQFCPCNYIYGWYDLDSCQADCSPGQHTITSASCGKFLRCVVRVNNMPPSFCTSELLELFQPFGPLLMCDVPSVSPGVCRAYGVVIFKERGDGERAIHMLNGYLVGDNKLRVDWAYPSVPSGSKAFPFISMTSVSRREKRKMAPTAEPTTKRIFKKQPLLRGARKRLAAGFLFPKMQRFSLSHKTQRKNSNEEKKGYFLISGTVANNEPGEGGTETNLESGATKYFWRNPDAKFCYICGDEEQEHVELTCPYNYLSPASYAPCKARFLFWQNETTDIRRFGRPKGGPILNEITLRRLEFL
uniref:Uncharacterized protein n=1 Tax=Avena sativa TaxID=4498 RepID=A0ACD5UYF0_AVESA